MERFLEPTGAVLLFAENGKEAIDRVREFPVDLILMDLQMPVVDGFEATRELRSSGFTGPIIALSAAVTPAEKTRAESAGMDEHLSKPIEREELYRALARRLGEGGAKVSSGAPVSEAASSPAPANLLPQTMPGFDPVAGLRRCSGDEVFYIQQLIRFRDAIDERYRSLPDLVLRGDHKTAGRVAHSLKGTAGAVSAVRLQETSERFNKAIHNEEPIDQDLVQELSAALNEARSTLDSITLPRDEDDQTTGSDDDTSAEAVRALYEKLSRNEFIEQETIDRALSNLRTESDRDRCDELRTLLDRFETDMARALLETLMNEMDREPR